jgi:hypothetical protein
MVLTFLRNSYLRIVDGLSKSEISDVKSGFRALENNKIHHERINDYLDKLLMTITPNESNSKFSPNSTTKPINMEEDLDDTSFESDISFQYGEGSPDFSVDWVDGEEDFSKIISNIPRESPWLIGMSEGFIRSITHR